MQQAEAAAAGTADPPEPKLLLHQNRQLAHRIEEMRGEKRATDEHLQRLERQQRKYDLHLSAVDRTWSALDESLRGLLARADLSVNLPAAPAPPPSATPSLFLQRLLQKTLPAEAVDEAEVDAALKKRSEFTAEILAQVSHSLLPKSLL